MRTSDDTRLNRNTPGLRKKARERFLKARKVNRAFARQLKGVAEQVGRIVEGFAPGGYVDSFEQLNQALRKYSDLLQPWARSVAAKMIAEVDQRDEHAWAEMGRELGRQMRKEIRSSPIGSAVRQLMGEQVELITSIPLSAARRVHRLTIEAASDSTRAKDIAEMIMKTGDVTKSRAMLIARTEVARTAAVLTQVRAQHVGCEGYIWRTSEDADVRERHQKLEGKFIKWDQPPIAGENGERAHAGMIYNCRCWMEPVLPDIID